MSNIENDSLSPQPNREAEMFMDLYTTGATYLGSVQWFIADIQNLGLVLHYTKNCKDYTSRVPAAMPVDSSFVSHKERTGSLLEVHNSGTRYTVCPACGQDALNGDHARQQGHKLYNGFRQVALAKETASTLYENYTTIGKSIVTMMVEQDIRSILYGSPTLLPSSRVYTLDTLRDALRDYSFTMDEFNHEMVCLSAIQTLLSWTRTDMSVANLCKLSDEDTVHGLRIAWARGLNQSFRNWSSKVVSNGHTCPDTLEYAQSHSDEFLEELGISKETILKAVSSWTQEYQSLRAMSGLEYVAIYGVSGYHYSTPRDAATIAVHMALLHQPAGSFAYGIMPKVAALYLNSTRVRNSRTPQVIPLDIPYDPDKFVGPDVLDTALVLFKSDNGIFYQNAEKSLQAAIYL